VRSRCQIFGASWPIAKHRVPLRPAVLEYQGSRQISPIRRDRMSLFLRKCSSTRKGCLASSLLLPLRRHTPSAAPESCALAGTCSFLRDRRPTHPRICRRLEFLLVCPNHGPAFLQNVKISSRLARLHSVRKITHILLRLRSKLCRSCLCKIALPRIPYTGRSGLRSASESLRGPKR